MKSNWKLRVGVLLVLVYLLLIGAIRQGYAMEPDRCATIIPTDQNTPYVHFQRVSVDDGLAITSVASYLWLQNIAGEPTHDHSVVSIDLNALPEGEVTLCVGDTSYTEAEAEVMTRVQEGPPEWVFATPDPEPRVLRVWVPL
mgnify:CR=1 FL=1